MKLSDDGQVLLKVYKSDLQGDTFIIPPEVTTIGNDAFDNGLSLKSIIIPERVSSIGEAFRRCNTLQSITLSANITSIAGRAQTKEQVQNYLSFVLSYQKKHGMGFYLVFEKESGSFIGEAGLFHLLFDDTQPEIEVGYHLHKNYWGKGYATEITKALVHWGFQHLAINKIVASAYPDQIAS